MSIIQSQTHHLKRPTNFSPFLQVSRKRKNRKKKFFNAQACKRQKLDESVEVNGPSPSIPRTGIKKMKGEGFQPFDYSKVNFSRFRGGSRASAHIRNEGKPKVSSKSTNKSHPSTYMLYTIHTLWLLPQGQTECIEGEVVQR
jgi:hypothetical protein